MATVPHSQGVNEPSRSETLKIVIRTSHTRTLHETQCWHIYL